MATTVITVVVFVFFGQRLLGAARYALSPVGRARVGEIVRGLRFRHFWPIPIVFAIVVALAVLLLQVPGLSWGWWTALGGEGNPVTGLSDTTTGTALEWLVPVAFLTMLVPALPLFAWREEEIFRCGLESKSKPRRVRRAIEFGLAHALIGIPVAVALALSAGGWYFTTVYLRAQRRTSSQTAGLLESTRAHTAYNAVIIAVAFVAIIVTTVASITILSSS